MPPNQDLDNIIYNRKIAISDAISYIIMHIDDHTELFEVNEYSQLSEYPALVAMVILQIKEETYLNKKELYTSWYIDYTKRKQQDVNREENKYSFWKRLYSKYKKSTIIPEENELLFIMQTEIHKSKYQYGYNVIGNVNKPLIDIYSIFEQLVPSLKIGAYRNNFGRLCYLYVHIDGLTLDLLPYEAAYNIAKLDAFQISHEVVSSLFSISLTNPEKQIFDNQISDLYLNEVNLRISENLIQIYCIMNKIEYNQPELHKIISMASGLQLTLSQTIDMMASTTQQFSSKTNIIDFEL